ncbi:hypothetical protein TNCV_5019851 [Trichonephila clavipes]|nr:hypothetical protein TNCV_5019851 [Trichonephila clavipes]
MRSVVTRLKVKVSQCNNMDYELERLEEKTKETPLNLLLRHRPCDGVFNFHFQVWGIKTVLITAFEISNKFTSHPAAPAGIVRFAKSQKLILVNPPEDSYLPIELLIGGDFY